MFAIYDHNKKVAIWWSAKCGCSTIKSLYYNYVLKRNIENVHLSEACGCWCEMYYYKNVLTVRNPYDRIVSCYLDKYIRPTDSSQYLVPLSKRCRVNPEEMTFQIFVNHLFESFCLKTIEPFSFGHELHHTTPQFSEAYMDVWRYCNNQGLSFKFDTIHLLEKFDSARFIESIGYSNNELNTTGILDLNWFSRNVIPYKSIQKIENVHLLPRPAILEILKQNIKPDYSCFLSKSTVEKLNAIYEIDFRHLNYLYTPINYVSS